ncbi:MAG: serine hydrolase [Gemmatimonadaceae bacterium]|nr:serine hydrolase [Gemmatimonadaceae bacterium]
MTRPNLQARNFLQQKMREVMSECGVPALAAVLVRQAGSEMMSAQLGLRRIDASGASNTITSVDRFNLGSMSKVITAHLMGKLIQDKVGQLAWTTTLAEVFPQVGVAFGTLPVFRNVTVEQCIAHVSGMQYEPRGDDANAYIGWTAADLTKAKLMQRRQAYVDAAVRDPLICREPDGDIDPACAPGTTTCQPGDCVHYGGGGVICASMAEQRTGTLYEDLVRTHLYGPLGMAKAGFGVLSPGPLDGPWLHAWDPANFAVIPDTNSKLPAFSWHPRNPVGAACCSAIELGLFLREQVRPDPQLFTLAARLDMQTRQVSPASSFVRGGWSSSSPGSGKAMISHNGATAGSYSNMVVLLANKTAFGAMTNIHITFGSAAVDRIIAVMRRMDNDWNALFGASSPVFHECAHPRPAIIAAGPNAVFLFARRHTGAVVRRRGVPAALGNVVWDASVEFPSAVVTSGHCRSGIQRRAAHHGGRTRDRQPHVARLVDQRRGELAGVVADRRRDLRHRTGAHHVGKRPAAARILHGTRRSHVPEPFRGRGGDVERLVADRPGHLHVRAGGGRVARRQDGACLRSGHRLPHLAQSCHAGRRVAAALAADRPGDLYVVAVGHGVGRRDPGERRRPRHRSQALAQHERERRRRMASALVGSARRRV